MRRFPREEPSDPRPSAPPPSSAAAVTANHFTTLEPTTETDTGWKCLHVKPLTSHIITGVVTGTVFASVKMQVRRKTCWKEDESGESGEQLMMRTTSSLDVIDNQRNGECPQSRAGDNSGRRSSRRRVQVNQPGHGSRSQKSAVGRSPGPVT